MNVTIANDDYGPPFKFIQSWCILREHYKIMIKIEEGDLSNKEKRVNDGLDDVMEDGSIDSTSGGDGGANHTESEIHAKRTGLQTVEYNATRDETGLKKLQLTEQALKAQNTHTTASFKNI